MDYVCEITHQSAKPTLSIRTRSAGAEPARGDGPLLRRHRGLPGQPWARPRPIPVYSAYYNMDMADLDVEIGFGVAAPLPGQGEIAAGWLPEGDVASLLYVGPYDGMAPAYEALGDFMQQKGRQPTGVAYEYYLNDPSKTARSRARPHRLPAGGQAAP